MQTILCEKADVYRKFGAALGGFTGQSASVGDGSPYRVVHASGHLFELKPLDEMVDPRLIESFKSWRVADLPFDHELINFQNQIIHKKVNGESVVSEYHANLFHQISQSLSDSDTVLIATDLDPSGEGDLLAWEILNAANFKGKALRVNMVDDSTNGILNALQPSALKPVAFTDPFVQAALARQRFDFYTIQYTRVLTTLPQDHHVLSSGYVNRGGRLKSAMLQRIGEREEAYDTFVPSSEFELAYFDSEKRKFTAKDGARYKTPALALTNPEKFPDSSQVKQVSQATKSITPPNLFDLMDLSGSLAQKGYDTSSFMRTYQSLYEAKYVTYPRTEDTVITVDQLNEFRQVLPRIVTMLNIDSSLIDPNRFATKNLYNPASKKAAPTHGANRPGSRVPDTLDDLKSFGPLGPAIYEECARQILASFAPDKINLITTYSDLSGGFTHHVTDLQSAGWTMVFKSGEDEDESSDDDGTTTHPVVGSELTLGSNEIKARRPSLFTQRSLAKELKKYDVGTGATRTTTFDDIIYNKPNRVLAKFQGSGVRLTNMGKIAFVLMSETHLADIVFTQNLNLFLNQIKSGQATAGSVSIVFKRMFNSDLPKIKSNAQYLSTFKTVKDSGYSKIDGIYLPTNTSISIRSGLMNHAYTEDELKRLFSGETIEVPLISKNKTPFIGVLKIENAPEYGWGTRIVDRKFAPRKTFTGVYEPTGETITFTAVFNKKDLSDDDCRVLLKGRDIKIDSVSKTGGSFVANLVLVKASPYKQPEADPIWQVSFKPKGSAEQHTQVYTPTGAQISIPVTFMEHTFTTSELNMLFTGKPIVISTARGDTSIDLIERANYNRPGKAIQLGFYKDPSDYVKVTPPGETTKVEISRRAFGHSLTDAEIKTLESGETVSFEAKKRDGGSYTATVTLLYGKPYNGKKDVWHIGFAPRDW